MTPYSWAGGVVIALAALAAPTTRLLAAEPPEWLLGDWILNSELTHELQPEQRDGERRQQRSQLWWRTHRPPPTSPPRRWQSAHPVPNGQ